MLLDDVEIENRRIEQENLKFGSKKFSTMLHIYMAEEFNIDSVATRKQTEPLRNSFMAYIIKMSSAGGTLSALGSLRNQFRASIVAAALREMFYTKFPLYFVAKTYSKLQAPPNGRMNLLELVSWWARYVARALWTDFWDEWPWKLSAFPIWQVGVMLDLREEKDNSPAVNRLYDPSCDGLDILRDENGQYWTDWIYYPNHDETLAEAQTILKTYGPKSPQEACFAVAERMRDTRFSHGYNQYYVYLSNLFSTSPTGVGRPCIDDAAWLATYTQLLDFRWGGCTTSSRYMAITLRAMNIPTVTAHGAQVGAISEDSVNFYGTPIAASRNATINVTSGHTTVFCFGADLALSHGDDALYPGRSKQLTGLGLWKPARVLRWALETETLLQNRRTDLGWVVAFIRSKWGLREELTRAAGKWSVWSRFSHSAWNAVLQIDAPQSDWMLRVLDNLAWPCTLVRDSILVFPVTWPNVPAQWSTKYVSNLPATILSSSTDSLNLDDAVTPPAYEASARFALLATENWTGNYATSGSSARQDFVTAFIKSGLTLHVNAGAWAGRVVCAALLWMKNPTNENLLQLQLCCADVSIIGSELSKVVFANDSRLEWFSCVPLKTRLEGELTKATDPLFIANDWNIQIRRRYNAHQNSTEVELQSTQFLLALVDVAVKCLVWEAKWKAKIL